MTTTMTRTERRFVGLLTTLFAVFVHAVVWLMSSLWIMLGLGVAHHQWQAVPALGYWETYLVVAALGSLVGLLRMDFSKAKRASDGAA